MEIISRARWGARYARGFTSAPLPAAEVWLHHSVTLAPDLVWLDADRDGVDDDEEKAMRQLEQIGQDRFGGGISYTWLIPPSGRIYDGHGVDRQGAHTGGRNDRARAICFIGNYDTHKPTAAQVRSAAWLLQEGKRRGWLKAARLNGGHRDLKSTACPGKYAYALIDDINRLAAGPPITDQQEDDMSWDEKLRDGNWTPGGDGTARHALAYIHQISRRNANLATSVAALTAAVAADKDIDPAQLGRMVDEAVARHTPTVEQTAAALLPLVEGIAEQVLGADNKALASEFIRQLRDALPEGN